MTNPLHTILLTPDTMTAADQAAARSGIDSFGLMERAGQAVAAAALRHYPEARRFVVLCGPGNNGGDGYVAARALQRAGCTVALFALGDVTRLKGDAARAARLADRPAAPLDTYRPVAGDVVVDALFGAGLSRDVPEAVAAVIERVNGLQLPVVAVDLPSGVSGLTGQVRGAAFQAQVTVTFMTRKPGHLLLPGRSLCGSLEVFDIGIPHRIIRSVAGLVRANDPSLWTLPQTNASSHKFTRGHLGVFSGGAIASGAARLSAIAGLKAGAGLVTIGARAETLGVLANHLTAIMLRSIEEPEALDEWLGDKRLTAFVLGPGFGAGALARELVHRLAGRPLVLDADGITSFREEPDALFRLYQNAEKPSLVLTPHEGEFARLFPDIAADNKLGKVEKALAAAARAHAVVIYKGADTVIAEPGGYAAINENGPPWLATAGSGDVLAGITGGLMAQGMAAFDAASAAVYLHGQAGQRAGPGLTAEDLPQHIFPLTPGET